MKLICFGIFRSTSQRLSPKAEKQALGLVGLVPDATETMDTQLNRVRMQLGHKTTDLDRYVYLINLLDHDETLFYRTIMADPAYFFAHRL